MSTTAGLRLRAAGVAAVTLATGLFLFRYVHGPVRSWFGDVLVIVFLVAVLAAIGVPRPSLRLAIVGVVAVATEGFQGLGVVPKDAHWLVHLTLGSTFDPWDFLAYAAGLAAAAAVERSGYLARPGPTGGPP